MRIPLLAAAVLVMGAALAAPPCGPIPRALAQQQEAWETRLKVQLFDEQKCELLRVITLRQSPLPGRDGLEGRALCTDGREFDFTRPGPNHKFTIHLCQPVLC
jgi:hypothetical protein